MIKEIIRKYFEQQDQKENLRIQQKIQQSVESDRTLRFITARYLEGELDINTYEEQARAVRSNFDLVRLANQLYPDFITRFSNSLINWVRQWAEAN